MILSIDGERRRTLRVLVCWWGKDNRRVMIVLSHCCLIELLTVVNFDLEFGF